MKFVKIVYAIASLLTLLLTVLRIFGVVHWVWYWVLSPLWITVGAYAVILAIYFTIYIFLVD